jgi:hypothetical protein
MLGGAAITGGTVCALGYCSASNLPPKPARTPEEEAQADAEWNGYKDRYNEPPPHFNDLCERWKWELAREERLLNARRAWDSKWWPGRHSGNRGEEQAENAIEKLKDKIKRLCPCP